MEKQQLVDFIRNHVSSSEENLKRITAEFEEVRFAKNDYFLTEGKVCNYYLFLEEGFMRSFTIDIEGNEVTTYFHSHNKVVFDVSSFFSKTPATENIQALTESRGYLISHEKLNLLFHSMPEFREFGRAMLVKEFSAFKERTLALINKSAEERYSNLIQSNKEIFQYAQLRYIASFLGITDTSLSRIRKSFSEK